MRLELQLARFVVELLAPHEAVRNKRELSLQAILF
jgi:hypothetical protein